VGAELSVTADRRGVSCFLTGANPGRRHSAYRWCRSDRRLPPTQPGRHPRRQRVPPFRGQEQRPDQVVFVAVQLSAAHRVSGLGAEMAQSQVRLFHQTVITDDDQRSRAHPGDDTTRV